MKKNIKKALITTLVTGSSVHPVYHTLVYAQSNADLAEVIITIEKDANLLPIEPIKAHGTRVADLSDLFQQKRKSISKKIAEVTDATKPKVDEKKDEKDKDKDKKDNDKEKSEKDKSESKDKEKSETKETSEKPKPTPKTEQKATPKPKPATPVEQPSGSIQFGSNGLLIEQSSTRAQSVVNGLLGIPGHSNGAYYHQNGLDAQINTLSVPEAIWVIHRIEGAGFGQTGDGYAGLDTPQSHQTFVKNQVNRRFGGSVHALLRAWGTFSYGGY